MSEKKNGEVRVIEMAEKEKEKIVIKAGAIEQLIQSENMLNKTFPVKAGYWLARVFAKARQEFRPYVKTKQKLIDEYSDKEKSANMPEGQFFIMEGKRVEFNKKLELLVHTEVNLNISKIDVEGDQLPHLTLKEMEMLLPILNIKFKAG